jgi:uncharacterized protein YaeQ
MKYTFTVTEVGWEREKLVLESRAGESDRHIALKILAFILYRGEIAPLPLRIEPEVGQRHRPDLVATDPETDAVRLWIDCGQIETKRLGRIVSANPQAQIVIVKSTENEARLYAHAALRYLPDEATRRERVRFLGFDDGFLAGILTALRGVNEISVNRTEEGATFTVNSATYYTGLRPLFASLLCVADKKNILRGDYTRLRE